jgi:hypothetical protein
MNRHKSRALEDSCLCNKCPLKFACFTQERIFSDPIFQGLFEALMAKGHSREEAVDMVANELKTRMLPSSETPMIPVQPTIQPNNPIWIYPPNAAPNSNPYYWGTITICDNNSGYTVVYTMADGEEVSWKAGFDGSFKC